jgi:hypothetical protein
MGLDYLAGLFIHGRIIPPPPKNLKEKWIRTWVGVTQGLGRIIGSDISFWAG